jgi:hypothetical protein
MGYYEIGSLSHRLVGGFNVRDYGAVGNNVVDDGPAFQAAFDAAFAAGGSTVYAPDGKYRIATPVVYNHIGSSIAFIGNGEGAQLYMDVGLGVTAFQLVNCVLVEIEGFSIIGQQTINWDCIAVFDVGSNKDVSVHDIRVGALKSQIGVVYAGHCTLNVRHMHVNGLTTSYFGIDGVICYAGTAGSASGFPGLTVSDVSYVDLAGYQPGPLVVVGNSGAYPPASGSENAPIMIRDCFVDEVSGGLLKVIAAPTNRILSITVEQCTINLNGGAGTPPGIHVQNTDYLAIRQVLASYATVVGLTAISLSDVKNTIIEHCSAYLPGTAGLVADATCKSIYVRDSVFDFFTVNAAVELRGSDDGIEWEMTTAAGAVTANTLAKVGTLAKTASTFGTADALNKLLGVFLETAIDTARVKLALLGQAVPVKVDGALAIVPGDDISPSTITAGRVEKSVVAVIGQSRVAVAATADLFAIGSWQR